MVSEIIYCPPLNRDIRGILKHVPNPRIATGKLTGEWGCINAHKDIVRRAKADGLSEVFVMEDDCEFTEHFNFEKWCAQVQWVRENGYNVLVGGCVQTYHPRVVDEGLIAVSAFHSAHCIVYLRDSYDIVLDVPAPLDLSIGQMGAKVLMTFPFVAVQRPAFSGILNKDVDYMPLYKGYEENLGRMLGIL